MAGPSSTGTHLISSSLFLYEETMSELHSYITSSMDGRLTEVELLHYYRQRHDNSEIPYHSLGYQSLLDLLNSDQRQFHIDLSHQPPYINSKIMLQRPSQHQLDPVSSHKPNDENVCAELSSHSSNTHDREDFEHESYSPFASTAISIPSTISKNSNICYAASKTKTTNFEGDRVHAGGSGGGIYARIIGGRNICRRCEELQQDKKEIPVDIPLIQDIREKKLYHISCAIQLQRWSYIDLSLLSQKKKKYAINHLSADLLKPYISEEEEETFD